MKFKKLWNLKGVDIERAFFPKNRPIADHLSGALDTGYLPQIPNTPPWLHKKEENL